MNIIVEGPDCSGKSTLVDRVKNELRWDSRALHHKEGDQFLRYLREYASLDQTVIDRAHFSEDVYSALWNRKTPFSDEERNILDGICKARTLILFAYPSIEAMQQRYNARNFKQTIQFDELVKSRELFHQRLHPICDIVYTSSDYEELENVVEKVKRMVRDSYRR